MSKAILEFNLPEDREDFEMAQNGWKFRVALQEIDEDLLRALVKYDAPKGTETSELYSKLTDAEKEIVRNFVDALRSDFYEIINETGATLYEKIRI